MNIALFSDSYIPTKSGIVTVVVQLRNILEQMGHHVVIVTVSNHRHHNYGVEDPNIFKVTSIQSPVGEGQFMGLPHRKSICEFLQKHNIQIIHAHTEFFVGQIAVACGKKLHIPVIATTHTMWEDYYRYYFSFGNLVPRKVVRKIVKRLYKRYFAFINVSDKAKNYFTQGAMLPKTPCAVVPNAIDFSKFSDRKVGALELARIRKSIGLKKNDQVVLYVGRVVEEKRVVELLEIMMRVVRVRPNVKMVFVGSGGALEELKQMVEEAGLEKSIIFTGFIDWQKVYAYYALGNIFVTTSLSEMHSMTILEAMSMALPTVCRRDSSFNDTIFHGNNGYFADTDEDMDGYLYDLIDNPKKAEEMGRNAAEIVKDFTLQKHGQRTVAFYQACLDSYPRRPTSAALKKAVDSIN